MKSSGWKHIRLGKFYLYCAYSFRGIGLGFSIDRYTLNLDLIFFSFTLEL